MSNFGIRQGYGYGRLISENSISLIDTNISNTPPLSNRLTSVKNSVVNYEPDNPNLLNYGRGNRDDGRATMRTSISLLAKVVTGSDKRKISEQNLAILIDKMDNNDITYLDIKKHVKTYGDLKILHDSINNKTS